MGEYRMENQKRGSVKEGRRKKRRRQRRCLKLGLLILLLFIAYRGMTAISGSWHGDAGSVGHWFAGEQQESVWSKADSLLWLDGSYPDSLRKLAQNNPETIDFVKQYPNKKDRQDKIDVSGDLTGDIPLFLQWDERWGYRKYGGDYMAVNGCGPTCLSMVYCGLTGKSKWNPYQVAKQAEQDGYYVKGTGTSWDLMTNGASGLGLKVEKLPLDETKIVNHLQQKQPIICTVGPGDFTTQGHFLVLTGVDKNGKILINDPNSKKRSEKKWDLDRLMSQIRNLWAYSL